MEELLCSIEIVKDNNTYTARIQNDYGSREVSSDSFEDVIEQFVVEIQEEFESL